MSKGSEGSAGKRPTKLYPGEADTSLAMRAVQSVVLSLDAKPGPIYDAYQRAPPFEGIEFVIRDP